MSLLKDKQALDLIFSIGIFVFIIAPRFNTWTKSSTTMFSDKPLDFIDKYRYYTFCGLYLLTFIILLCGTQFYSHLLPQDTIEKIHNDEIIKTLTEVFGHNSLTVHLLIITAILNNSKVNYWDEHWRYRLHYWARIPRAVEEVRDSIILRDAFNPQKKYISLALAELKGESEPSTQGNQLLEYWEHPFAQWQREKEQNTIHWYYIKCLCLFVMARDVCDNFSSAATQAKRESLHNLAKIIPYPDKNEGQLGSQKKKLEDFSKYFIEIICKHIVKKYPSKENQNKTFNNLGFAVVFQDTKEFKLLAEILYCVVGIIFVTGLTTGIFIVIQNDNKFKDIAIWQKWTIGAVVSYCISIFIGVLIQKISSSKQDYTPGLGIFLLTYFLATLATITTMQLRGTQMAFIPQLSLALTYSALAVITFLSLEEDSIEQQDVINNTVKYGVGLAVSLAFLHTIVSISFVFSTREIHTLSDLPFSEILKNTFVGFIRGGLLGALVSYLIQSSIRQQKLAALRSNPRVKLNNILFLEHNGARFPVNAKDLSKGGIRLITKKTLKAGEKVTIDTNIFGKVSGVILWTQAKFSKELKVGIKFDSEYNDLNKYIRQRFGEYYA